MRLWKLQFSVASLFVVMTLTAAAILVVQNWPRPPTMLELVEEFNQHMEDRQYQEAIVVAEEANRLFPDDEIIETMKWKARFAQRITGARQFAVDDDFHRGFVCLGPDYDFEEPPHPEVIDWAEIAARFDNKGND